MHIIAMPWNAEKSFARSCQCKKTNANAKIKLVDLYERISSKVKDTHTHNTILPHIKANGITQQLIKVSHGLRQACM